MMRRVAPNEKDLVLRYVEFVRAIGPPGAPILQCSAEPPRPTASGEGRPPPAPLAPCDRGLIPPHGLRPSTAALAPRQEPWNASKNSLGAFQTGPKMGPHGREKHSDEL